MQLYANPSRPDYHAQLRNNAEFAQLVSEFPDLTFFWPSPDDAPWHVQCRIGDDDGAIIINFWPHTKKAQREYCKSVTTWDDARTVIKEAMKEAWGDPEGVAEEFDVFEDV